MIDLKGQVALVTGSGTGIGRGIALKLAELGAEVVVNGRREAPCIETKDEITAEGGFARVMTADVSDEGEVARLFGAIEAQVGRLDILVNNAGVQRVGWFSEMREEEWDDVIRVNLKGPFLTTKAFVPLMRRQKYGRVVNIGSEAALTGAVGNANYVAAKAGLMGLTMNCALEMAIWARKDGGDYVCNLIHPGFNHSEMAAVHSDEQLERVYKMIPLGRPADSRHEVGAAVAFLASKSASYVTGAKFSAGGGVGMCIAS